MIEHEYYAKICRSWAKAECMRYLKVSFNGWEPKESQCHNNVDFWINKNPNYSAVRGWVNYFSEPGKVHLVSHSVVRDETGNIFNITPFADKRLYCMTRFVPHIGDEECFARVRNKYIGCKVDIAH